MPLPCFIVYYQEYEVRTNGNACHMSNLKPKRKFVKMILYANEGIREKYIL